MGRLLTANLGVVRARMAAAAEAAGRDPAAVTLIAVTKTHPVETIQMAYQAGMRHFGENRVEEAIPKIAAMHRWLAAQPGAEPIVWHMVGHLQSRKAESATGLFQLIHSVDRPRIVARLGRVCAAQGQIQPILLEVNLSGEENKQGPDLSADSPEEAAQRLSPLVEAIAAEPALRLQGLMTMAPIVERPAEARPVFRQLRALRDELARRFPGLDWSQLSMGMSDDFEAAIAEGATLVRIGRALFGERTA